MPPLVSIILPTYNRLGYLPDALQSIAMQDWHDWELVVVDDGSTDHTRAFIESQALVPSSAVRYVFQANQGAYGARNTGLDHAAGDLIAFFDSDDLWHRDYLGRLVRALQSAPAIDWAYAACRVETGGAVTAPSTFYVDGVARRFLRKPVEQIGDLRRLDSRTALECQISSGLYAGLQNSVIRRSVFAGERFWPDYRVVEDVLFLIRALARGTTIGYLDEVLVTYRVHADNSSASATGADAARLLPIFLEEVRGFERLERELNWDARTRRLLARKLADIYFWRLGYGGYWSAGRRVEALQSFRRGLRRHPLDWRMWKTFAISSLRSVAPSK
jgi:glycosyltransferase involved in cell wall biosynthesis